MPIKFTPSQRAAIGYRGGNLLLSAAAGSGKTAALTARIVGLLADGEAELSDMLVVTYTRAAAAEMRERIGKGLAEAAEAARKAGDAERLSRIARASAVLPTSAARISTIHSFLYQALKPCLPALGLSPDSRILEERTAKNLREETMKDTVDDFFAVPGDGEPGGSGPRASFPELADVLGSARDADAVDGELLWLDGRITAAGLDAEDLRRFADSLGALSADAGTDPLSTPWGAELRRIVFLFADHYIRAIETVSEGFGQKEAERYGQLDAAPLLEGLRERRSLTEDGREEDPSCGYEALRARLAAVTFERLPTVQKKDLTEAGAAYKLFRGEMKKELAALLRDRFCFGEEEIRQTAGGTARILCCLADVLAAFRDKLARRKRSMAALDYSDLELCAARLLIAPDGSRTRAAEEIGAGLKYVFIDEYQDTNALQDRIFRAVSPEARRFMVGDIKQSIYRFRGADPSVFSSYRDRWPSVSPEEAEREDLPVLAGEEGRSLFMSENFRCSEAVVDFANTVSAHLLSYGGVPFGKEDLLIHAREEPSVPSEDTNAGPGVEVVLIEKPRKTPGAGEEERDGAETDADEEDGSGEPAGLDPEAEYAADRIASMLGRYLGGTGKILAPGDVAVLLRANKSAGIYRDALERRGIPAVMRTSRPLGSWPSVMLLTCLLNFVDNPLRDVYAAGTLRSPVFSFDLAQLIAVREAAGEMPLFLGVEALAREEAAFEPGEDPGDGFREKLRENCRAVKSWLGRHKAVSRGMAADRYTEFLLRDTDFFALDGIRENGAERDALNRFCAAVRGLESVSAGGGGGLSGLLEVLPDLLEAEESAAEAGGGKPSPDAVQVMSIHASKGLEFPVCFLCESAKGRNAEDERRTVLFDGELGFGMTLPDPGGLARCDTFFRQSIAAKTERESVWEEMRMLYVAMTRAREKLIVTGKAAKPDELLAESAAEALCADGYRAGTAGSYLAWILEALAASPLPESEVRVTVKYRDRSGEEAGEEPGTAGVRAEEIPSPDPADGGENALSEAGAAAGESEAGESEEQDAREAEFRRRFAFRYGDPLGLLRVPAKLTVSRLNPEILDGEGGGVSLSLDPGETTAPAAPGGLSLSDVPGEIPEEIPAPKRPAFMLEGGKKEATGAERGSATHVFFQFVNYRGLRENGVKAEIERLVREKFVSPATAQLIYVKQLERFRDSALLDKLLRSDTVKREFRFNALLPACRFTRDPEFAAALREKDAKVTVQGVVDCVFRDPDDGRLTLIDYKTDALTSEERRDFKKAAEKLLSRHRDQLGYYREICSDLFGEEIARTAIYSTVLGECVEVGVSE